MGGYQYQLLAIDLTSCEYKVHKPRKEVYENYLGGRGLGARLLYDLLPPGVDPLRSDNVIMFLTGPLTGTAVPGSGKYVVVTKSPISRGFVDSYASGRIAAEIKYAGYDGLIIAGRAEKRSYIYIENDKVEVREADFLWGKDTFATEALIREALQDEEVGISCIGPAGENLVKYATINSDYFRQAARGGVGAVMGSKNVKAIAVKGTGAVKSCNMADLLSWIKHHTGRMEGSAVAKNRMEYGTPYTLDVTSAAGMLPTSNFRLGVFDKGFSNLNSEGVKSLTIKSRGCYGCVLGCSKITRNTNGAILEGPEYETLSLLGSNLEVADLSAVIQANLLCDRLGLDTISTGNVIGFVMECMERGYLSPADVNGIRAEFGNADGVFQLLEDIAWRRGAGDWLAEGVRSIAAKVGRDAGDFAMHSKGLEFPGYDPRIGYGTALAYAVSPRGACHRRAWPPMVEVLGKEQPYSVAGKAQIVKNLSDEQMIFHSLLVCDFPAKWIPIKIAEWAECLGHVTGVATDAEKLLTMADRIETTIRLFNNREGFTRADDNLPPRVLREGILNGPAHGHYIPPEDLAKLLDEYYAARGWNEQGVPCENTLARLNISLERGNPFCD